MKFILSLLATIALACAPLPLNADTHLASKYIDEVAQVVALPKIDLGIIYQPCGEVNAYYFPGAHVVVVCNELLREAPGFQRMVFAHEYGHAVIEQWGIPYTGSEEVASDEFAAVVLGSTGHVDDLLEYGLYFALHPREEQVRDPHPSNGRRAAWAMCMGDGAEDEPVLPECKEMWDSAVARWVKLLSTFHPDLDGSDALAPTPGLLATPLFKPHV